jgi:hypothetical protein
MQPLPASLLEPCVAPVEPLTSALSRRPSQAVRRLALAALLPLLAAGCAGQPAPALRRLWREVRPEPWRPVELESAARVGPHGDWWVRVRMEDGRRVEDVIAPWSRSKANAPWVMAHSQPLGTRPETRRTPPAGAVPVATRGPEVPRVELRSPRGGHVSAGLFLVEVEGAPGEELGRYGLVPGSDRPRWRRDRVWLRVLLTPPAAVVDAGLFILNLPLYVLWPRGFHT